MTTTTTTTTGYFNYLDPATLTPTSTPSGTSRPWAKVDVNSTSYSQTSIGPLPVTSIRTLPTDSYSTDITGFSLFHSPLTTPVDFESDASVRGAYYQSVESLLREKLPRVKKVVIFDHTIRKRDPGAPRQPVQSVHVDQTPKAAEARVRRHVTDTAEAEGLLRGRYQIVNVWRPIGHVASDFPLALIDWRSTRPENLIAVELLYPVRKEGEDDGDDRGKEVLPDPETLRSTEGYEVKGETYGVVPSEGHRFYYVKDMTPEEALFIKCFDSRAEGLPGGRKGVAALTPHTAFVDPQTPEGTKGRESIEVRCLVFYDEE
ncbi:hypothetical protein B0T14DRAFT_559332 [Immersiella caudata]|uniref:7alpha-cephem-methoxylase P8 chain n=1 Tax=Immersiella caudata TaxID=314043 RepID=A0AA39XCR5_9PEZI|nr:hypothetical protein B0T14DRAFT_559332 [Immersiella caudata]